MNIKEALQVLENAAASDADELKQIFSSEYKHLRKAIVKHAPHALLDKVIEAKEFSLDYPFEKVKTIDKAVKSNPWAYIGGAALLAGLVGLILGKRDK